MILKEELDELRHRLERIEAGGNDGADIYDYNVFLEYLMDKYGKEEVDKVRVKNKL